MLGIRLLVIVSECAQADVLADMVLDAVAHGARPFSLRFALPLGTEAVLQELPQEPTGGVRFQDTLLFYPQELGLAGVLPLLTDETHFLFLKGPHAFGERWDQGLEKRWRKLPAPLGLLTGFVGAPQGNQPPQAYLPAFGRITEQSVEIVAGTPLVCASATVKTMVVNPGLVFGGIRFLHQADTREEWLSIAAFVAEFAVYAVETPLLWPLGPSPKPYLRKPTPDDLPGHFLARFEQFAGLSFGKGLVGVRSSLGLFSQEERYPQKMPGALMIAQQARVILARGAPPMPMLTSAFVDLPDAFRPTLWYMIRFAYLRALGRLPLLLYTAGSQARSLKMRFPNAVSYPDSAVLPKSLLAEDMRPMEHFARSKFLLLHRAMRSYPGFSHYAWVDADILDHPVCPGALPDFSHLMDGRIHLAMAEGQPDGSFMVVPRQHLKLLVREVQALSQVDAAIRRSFSEAAMLRRLVEKFPDLFTLHPMPRRHLLLASCLDPLLLSREYRAELAGAPPPVPGETAFGAGKGGNQHEGPGGSPG